MTRVSPEADEPTGDSPRPLRRRRSLVQPYTGPHFTTPSTGKPVTPKIRRASLFADPDTSRSAPLNEDETEDVPAGRTRQLRSISSEHTRTLPAHKQSAIQHEDDVAAEPTWHMPSQKQHKLHIPPGNDVAERARAKSPYRQTARPAVTPGFFRGRPLMIAISVVIALSIIGGTIFAVTRPRGTPTLQAQQGRNSISTGGSTQEQSAANPHELVIVPADTDHPPPPVYAAAAYLLDANTGATLYAYNPFMHLPEMSTTKLMTAIVAVQKGNLDQNITINKAIWHDIQQLSADSSLFGMKEGQTYTLRQLLYGLLLVSGNDAAVAIADAIDGSVPNFVADMNHKAQQLHLYDTHFMNPHGLAQTGHYSSAHDLAFLGLAAFSNPVIKQISATQIYNLPQAKGHPQRFLVNDNQFLFWYPGVDAGKPGWDGGSNFVQVISVTRNHRTLIGVTIHTRNWWTDMRDLMNWGFDNFTWISPYDVDLHQPIPFDVLWNYFTSDKKESTLPITNGRYYIYTGFSISGPIMTYFDQNGGLKLFGYPESIENVTSNGVVNQKFDHGTIQCSVTTNQCSSS